MNMFHKITFLKMKRRNAMYHISQDVRAQKSAELLADGLVECSKSKTFDQITVSDISAVSTVSRATFYRLFDNTYDILQYICDRDAEEVFSHTDIIASKGLKYFILNFLSGLMEHRQFVSLLAESNHLDMIRIAHEKYYDKIRVVVDQGINDQDIADYIVEAMASALPSMLRVWVMHGEKETPEELYNLSKESLNFVVGLFE
jgi:AcrR family transcriptional regulator